MIDRFLDFIENSPTAWHAVATLRQQLRKADFEELHEEKPWSLKPKGRYFTTRNGSSIVAFIVPAKTVEKARVLGAHTDSPGFKLKPQALYKKENLLMAGVEVYGGPLLTSWLNRDLGIAGRVVHLNSKGEAEEKLVFNREIRLTLPQLAIHLDRNVNENGLVLNKQEQLAAIVGINNGKKPPSLGDFLGIHHLLAHDLFLVPLEPPHYIGWKKELIASYRLDNLVGVFAATEALLAASPSSDTLKIAAFYDNEEIGSETAQGAGSPFFPHLLERIVADRETYFRLLPQSLCVSVDLTHAYHPNYPDKHEVNHKLLMGEGAVVKSHAQHRYASDARTMGVVAALAAKHKLALHAYAARGDIPAGTTIGPIHAHLTGMPTVDMGIAQLSMHAARELMATSDLTALVKILTYLIQETA